MQGCLPGVDELLAGGAGVTGLERPPQATSLPCSWRTPKSTSRAALRTSTRLLHMKLMPSPSSLATSSLCIQILACHTMHGCRYRDGAVIAPCGSCASVKGDKHSGPDTMQATRQDAFTVAGRLRLQVQNACCLLEADSVKVDEDQLLRQANRLGSRRSHSKRRKEGIAVCCRQVGRGVLTWQLQRRRARGRCPELSL